MFPYGPPYGEIADLLKQGQVVPFLGAGVNLGKREPATADWDAQTSTFLPKGAELSKFLAEQCNFPSTDNHDINDLAKVSSYFVETIARRRLRQRLHRIFNQDFAPCDIHTYLAQNPKPLLIVTTNYDDLTEQAFKTENRPYDLVVHPTDRKDVAASVLWWKHGSTEPVAVPPNKLYIDLKTTDVIYKMHGTVARLDGKWDSYVITEEDYVDFLSRMTGQTAVPALFMRHFRNRYFLFLGYGLQDWNLRVMLRNLRAVLPIFSNGEDSSGANENDVADVEAYGMDDDEQDDEPNSWAIQYKPSTLEVQLWSARNVKIYDVDINDFVKRLREQNR